MTGNSHDARAPRHDADRRTKARRFASCAAREPRNIFLLKGHKSVNEM
jgi:hypothetical protein